MWHVATYRGIRNHEIVSLLFFSLFAKLKVDLLAVSLRRTGRQHFLTLGEADAMWRSVLKKK